MLKSEDNFSEVLTECTSTTLSVLEVLSEYYVHRICREHKDTRNEIKPEHKEWARSANKQNTKWPASR